MLYNLKNFLVIFYISLFLFFLGCILKISKKINGPSFIKLVYKVLLKKIRKPFYKSFTNSHHDKQNCYLVSVPWYLISDQEGISSLKLFENGKELPYKHEFHDSIREVGFGRYSHFGNAIFFSTSDNSNPNNNKRIYEIYEC